GQVIVELDHILEGCSDRGQRVLQVLERLFGLGTEVAGRSRDLTLDIEPQLPGDIDDPARRRGLDHVRIARRLGYAWRIDETRAHGNPPHDDLAARSIDGAKCRERPPGQCLTVVGGLTPIARYPSLAARSEAGCRTPHSTRKTG